MKAAMVCSLGALLRQDWSPENERKVFGTDRRSWQCRYTGDVHVVQVTPGHRGTEAVAERDRAGNGAEQGEGSVEDDMSLMKGPVNGNQGRPVFT